MYVQEELFSSLDLKLSGELVRLLHHPRVEVLGTIRLPGDARLAMRASPGVGERKLITEVCKPDVVLISDKKRNATF